MDVFLFLNFGTPEIVVIAIVGLLLFGRRLPEVGRSFGKSFMELRRGMTDIKSELRDLERQADEEAARPRGPRGDEVVKEPESWREATVDQGSTPPSSDDAPTTPPRDS